MTKLLVASASLPCGLAVS